MEKVSLYPDDCSAACDKPAVYDVTYSLTPPYYDGRKTNTVGTCGDHLSAIVIAFMTSDGVTVTRHMPQQHD